MIQDFGLMDMIATRLVPDHQARLTPGEAVAGMILNGLGVANRPRSCTPQLCASTPLDRLLREGIEAEMFNRCKLGRRLDEATTDGCDRVLQELALAVCAQAGIALRFNHLDTTSFARRGESGPDSDAPALTMTHGYSKDHRPDLQPAVLELLVSHDGGGPCVSQRWDGTPSDIQRFQARAQALRHAFTHTPSPRYLVAEATLDHEDQASSRPSIGVITRLPTTSGVVAQVLRPALEWDTWQPFADHPRDPPRELCHSGMAPRGLVVSAQAALECAAATRTNATQREPQAITTPLVHGHAQRCGAPSAAQAALAA